MGAVRALPPGRAGNPRSQPREPGGRRAERWSLLVVVACVAAAVGAGFRLAGWGPGSVGAARWPAFVAGLVLMAAGIGLRQRAILALGRFFTVDVRVHPDQTVVERGPYR